MIVFSRLAVLVAASFLPSVHANVPAASNLGMNLLRKARRIEENNDYQEQSTWVSGYSIHFEGCHYTSNADGTFQRFVHFRLCPTDSCSNTGCNSGYGDYIVDLYTYLETYFAYKNSVTEDYYTQQHETYTGYHVYPYIAVQNYMQCTPDTLGLDSEQYGNAFYLGPYCAMQGGEIHMGLFQDDTCTTFYDRNGGQDAYLSLTGQALMYRSQNIVDTDCISCQAPGRTEGGVADSKTKGYYFTNYSGEKIWQDVSEGDYYEYYNDRQGVVSDECSSIYSRSGKCERVLDQGTSTNFNNEACGYIESLVTTTKIESSVARMTKREIILASILTGVFTVSLASIYVYYKGKRHRGINLLKD